MTLSNQLRLLQGAGLGQLASIPPGLEYRLLAEVGQLAARALLSAAATIPRSAA